MPSRLRPSCEPHRLHGRMGYPRSTVLSVALQTLRRLSEETGGIYVESDVNYDLPRGFLDDPYANVDTGGHFIVDLNGARTTPGRDPRLLVRFETASAILPSRRRFM